VSVQKNSRVILIVDGEVVAKANMSQAKVDQLIETFKGLSEERTTTEDDPDWWLKETKWADAWAHYDKQEILSLP